MAKTKIHGEYLDASVISGQTQVTAVGADSVLIFDATDNALKKALASDFGETNRLPLAGGTMTGDLILNDNVRLELGSASGGDLQIYHDGSDSYITDTGTGNLLIQYSDLYFSKDAGSTHSVVFRSTGRVGIGTTGPDTQLHVKNESGIELRLEADSNNSGQEDCFVRFYTDGKTQEGIVGMDNNNSSTLFSGNTENAMVFGTVSNLPVVFATNNTERVQIGSGGEVGIGTTSPQRLLHLYANSSGDTAVMRIQDNGSHVAGIELFSGHGNWGIYNSDTVADALEFRDESASALRMIMLNDGEIVQGSAIADTYAPLVNGITGDALVVGRHSTSGSLGLWRSNTMEFKYYHNGMGYVMTFASNGVISGDFNDTSDVNLKENISSISDGTTIIKALRPVKFDWKASGKGNNQHGFIAQEVETVLPDAVEGNDYVENKTGLPEDEPEQNGKTMNSNAVLAHAVKAIQELEARIEALES